MICAPHPPTVVFDVDGTLVDSERHGHRVAFNEAFADFGLPYVWDEATYGELLAIAGGHQRLRSFLVQHGHDDDEADALAGELHAHKTRRFQELCQQGHIPARPGVQQLLDDCARAGMTVAVATTGSREWVAPLLERLFGLERFALVLTGSEVPRRKPASDVYDETCRRLQLHPDRVVAVEDSANGLTSARRAGLACLVVLNDYTCHHDVTGAALVVDGFRDASVLHGPTSMLDAGAVTAATVAALARCGAAPG